MRLPCVVAISVVLASVVDVSAQTPLRTRVYASGFSAPVAFIQDPGDRNVQYVVQQAGRIRVIRNEVVLPTDFLNLTTSVVSVGEQGLLGLAFPPDYASSGRFFVYFTRSPDGHTVLARFQRSSSNPLVADPASRFDLRWGGATGPTFITQPFGNHKGGHLAFGPDGCLYLALGDGGSGNDPAHRAQNPAELLGKMLRIDVNVPNDHPSGYEVPPSNPFIGAGPPGTRPEIWSFGWRNPWRWSFDNPAHGGTGAIVVGDVGQGAWEEIDYEPPNRGGRNYGWRNREGAHDNLTSPPPAFLPLTDPIHEYPRTEGTSVTGGYVYRGRGLGAAHHGRYFFADFSRARVWSLGLIVDPVTGEAQKSNLVEHTAELGGSQVGNVSAFGTDAEGELYIVSYSFGRILRVLGVPPRGDFDADGKTDIGVFRPSSGVWWLLFSRANHSTFSNPAWGVATDVPAPGDYDGDGKTDIAVYRPSTGVWWVLFSGSNFSTFQTYPWGVAEDTPVPADYDGDGKTDIAIYRPSTGVWWVLLSSTTFTTFFTREWGIDTDTAVPADYEGDGKADLAVYRPSTGAWRVLLSTTNYANFVTYDSGVDTDTPVPADYDGDGKADIAVYRPAAATWRVLLSTTNSLVTYEWGIDTDTPVPADYDGDGKADIAIYRPESGVWWLLLSSTGFTSHVTHEWGVSTDVPLTKER